MDLSKLTQTQNGSTCAMSSQRAMAFHILKLRLSDIFVDCERDFMSLTYLPIAACESKPPLKQPTSLASAGKWNSCTLLRLAAS